MVIQRNRIENTGDAGILAGFDTSPEYFDLRVNPDYYEAIDGIVRNNVVRNTRYAGIGLYASKNTVVANNTIVNAASGAHSAIYFGVTYQDWDPAAKRPASVNPRIVNNLVIQNNNRCFEIRYSSDLGGLSGLAVPRHRLERLRQRLRLPRQPAGHGLQPGQPVAVAQCAERRCQQQAGELQRDRDGHLPAGSPAIDAGTVLAEVTDDIDGQARRAHDLGADEVGGGSPPPPTSPPSGRRSTGSQPLAPPSIAQAAAPRSAAARRGRLRPPAPAAAAAPAHAPGRGAAGHSADRATGPGPVVPAVRLVRAPVATARAPRRH